MALPRTTFSQTALRDIVRGDIGLRGNALLTDGDIDRWAVYAQRRVAEECHWLKTTATVDVVSGTAEYDLPLRPISIEELYHNNLPLLGPVPVDFLETWRPRFRQDPSGTPTAWYLRGATSLGLFPKPDTSLLAGLVVYYTAYPADPVNASDFYTAPTALEEAIICYAKLQASLKDIAGEGGKRVGYYQQEWQMWLQRCKDYVADVAEGEELVGGSTGMGWGLPGLWDNTHTIPGPP